MLDVKSNVQCSVRCDASTAGPRHLQGTGWHMSDVSVKLVCSIFVEGEIGIRNVITLDLSRSEPLSGSNYWAYYLQFYHFCYKT